MKSFICSVKQNLSDGGTDMVFIRDGFRLWAALFGPLWAVGLGLWLESAALLGVWLLFDAALMLAGIQGFYHGLAWIGFAAIMGFLAPSIQAWAMERRGYVFWDVVVAQNDLAAARRFADAAGPGLLGASR